jgi:cation diffusion facilitator family transporter
VSKHAHLHEVTPCTQLHSGTNATKPRIAPAEKRTLLVLVLTVVTMVAEIVAGTLFGSLALLADGWHMGSHAAALGIALFAYAYARRHADDPRYSFGTGKMNALGGFASAMLLACVAFGMLYEAAERFIRPVTIRYDHAIIVAVIGLVVNGASVFILSPDSHDHEHHHHHHDHNMRGVYLHVLADALTSLLAIGALVVGKYTHVTYVDPAVGVIGALLILKWGYGLVKTTSRELLDADVTPAMLKRVRECVENVPDTEVVDLHVWRLGPKHHAAIVSVVSNNPPEVYKRKLVDETALAHVTVEVNPSSK